MFRFNLFFALLKKEIQHYLNNAASYLSLIVFVFIWEFLFFRNVFLVGEASLRILYDYLPWLLLFFLPAISMNSFSLEKAEGTYELLLTQPVKILEVVLSKLFSGFLFSLGGLIFSFPLAFSISLFGQFDWGIYFSQFFSSVLLSLSLLSLGIFVSSLISSSLGSLLLTIGISFFFILSGSDFVTASLPQFLAPVFERISLLSRFSSLGRGVISLSDIWYFLSFILVFISLSCLSILKNKYGNRKDYFRSFQTAIYLFVGIALLLSILGDRIPGRIDLTSGKIYTLSETSKKILANLPDIVTLTYYSSGKLPSQLLPLVRETKETLRDFKSAGNNLMVVNKDPSADSKAAENARSLGVKEVQFNVIGQEEFQLKTGFTGIVVSYLDQHETIPFIDQTADLEYQLISLISKLTKQNKEKIAFLTGHGEKNLSADYQLLNTELGKQFNLQEVTIAEDILAVATGSAVLVISQPSSSFNDRENQAIRNYLQKGGNLLIMVSGNLVNPQLLNVLPNPETLTNLLDTYGLSLEKDLVYDLRSNETIRLGNGVLGFMLPYPYWLRAKASPDIPSSFAKVNNLLLPWASSIKIDVKKQKSAGYLSKILYQTSQAGGSALGENINISPDQTEFSQESLGVKQLVVISEKISNKDKTGKIILIGNSDFLTDQYLQNSSDNTAFAGAVLSYLTGSDSLAGIKIKQSGIKKFSFPSQTAPSVIKILNLALILILPAVFALIRYLKRKNLPEKYIF